MFTKFLSSKIRAHVLPFSLIALLGVACKGRPRAWDLNPLNETPRSGDPVVLEFDLALGAPEISKGGFLSIPSKHTFDTLVAALHQALERPNIKGVFVSFSLMNLGWARAHEVGHALAKLREKKIPVLCHADGWSNSSYAAAAQGCDTIAMSEGGEVDVTGPSAMVPYARELLVDKLKAQVDILQVGKFKGAAEPLLRDGPSEEYRQSIEGALSAIQNSYRGMLNTRGVTHLAGDGPFMGKEAVEQKLVDVLLDRKGARDQAKKQGNAPLSVAFGEGHEHSSKLGLLDFVRVLSQSNHDGESKPHVRLMRLHGEIALGSEGGVLGGPSGIVARRVVERARAIARDEQAKVVVLRIDSPGGSALGSDLAWVALKELRDAKKHLIISIGEMAASGGYYLASSGSRIFAEPESIVGSIGVVGGKISLSGTIAMAGIHTATFGDKRAASLSSMIEPWDAATRERLLKAMTEIYNLFLDRIATGRGKARAHFEHAVEGRVFGGERAKELGLIDEIGGLDDAINYAKQIANLGSAAPVVVDEPTGFFDSIGSEEMTITPASPLSAFTPAELTALQKWVLSFARSINHHSVAAILPTPLIVR